MLEKSKDNLTTTKYKKLFFLKHEKIGNTNQNVISYLKVTDYIELHT